MDSLPPPPGPPPLLSPEALHHLCTHGYWGGLALPQHLAAQYDALRAAMDAFFAQPPDHKRLYRPGVGRLGPPSSPTNTERGYTAIAGEKEYLTLRKSMTHLPGGIYDAAAPVWHDTARLLHRILGDLGVFLQLPGGARAWDAVVADSLEPGDGRYDATDPKNLKHMAGHPRDDPPTLLRLFRYEPGGGGAERHRDLGLLTLCVCWGRGLQVLNPTDDSSWIDAPHVTVMAGDTLHALTAYRVPSAVHRVVVDQTDADARRSIVFALRATVAGDIDLDPLGLDDGRVNARALYDTIRRRRVNINADKTTREAMRAAAQAGGKVPEGKAADEGMEDNDDDLGGVA